MFHRLPTTTKEARQAGEHYVKTRFVKQVPLDVSDKT